uniref:Transposase n=1 Tax=Caenorhabditis tropicalis TaxID=1561998 RepID=A0A1I7U261_9PELO
MNLCPEPLEEYQIWITLGEKVHDDVNTAAIEQPVLRGDRDKKVIMSEGVIAYDTKTRVERLIKPRKPKRMENDSTEEGKVNKENLNYKHTSNNEQPDQGRIYTILDNLRFITAR